MVFTSHLEKQDYHAHHLASLLTSLAQHYDQTSSALKDQERPIGQRPNIDPETFDILSKDAKEVHEVLEEMEDRVREIEHSATILQTHVHNIEDAYVGITNTFAQLEEYGISRLATHLSHVREFENRAATHKIHIQTLKQEMFNLVQYYTNFSSSYAALLIEVRRRTEANTHTTILVNEITAKLQILYEQEIKSRKAFMDLHAAFLPADLWKGIYDPPTRYVLSRTEGGKLPQLKEGKRLSTASMERRRSGLQGSSESTGKRSVDSSGRQSGEGSKRA